MFDGIWLQVHGSCFALIFFILPQDLLICNKHRAIDHAGKCILKRNQMSAVIIVQTRKGNRLDKFWVSSYRRHCGDVLVCVVGSLFNSDWTWN